MNNKVNFLKKGFFAVAAALGIHTATQAQVTIGSDTSRNAITTSVPFLVIAPDSRAAGMGDTGAATSPDANATYWNPAKLAFMDKKMGVALSYTPWLRNLVNDMSISYLSGYYKMSDVEAISVSLRYFNLGKMQFTDITGNLLNEFAPREFGADFSYSRKLSENLGIAGTARFIYSNLTGTVNNGTTNTNGRPGKTAAVDISMYYKNPELSLGSMKGEFAVGLNLSNIGAKMNYYTSDGKDFIPTNLRLGTALTLLPDAYNKLTVALDINKLMVPTPPKLDKDGNIIAGRDNKDRPLISGILGSFSDAPDGGKEELKEVMISTGLEYWYNNFFAARAGYFYEHKDKGGRQYLTLGLGLKYQSVGFDFAYLLPQTKNHPLANTLRFGLTFDLGGE